MKLRFLGTTGALMVDNSVLAAWLLSVTEFTVTEDHLRLLRRAWVDWDDGEGYGAPGINPKRPYGSSYVEGDIAEILDAPDEDWIWEDGQKASVTPEAEERLTRLHVETMAALQIVLATGEFRPGRYRRTGWPIDWQRDEGGQ
jgi:hypothetical protein